MEKKEAVTIISFLNMSSNRKFSVELDSLSELLVATKKNQKTRRNGTH